MKKPLLIAALVLVPFAALVAAGLLWLETEVPKLPVSAVAEPAPLPQPAPPERAEPPRPPPPIAAVPAPEPATPAPAVAPPAPVEVARPDGPRPEDDEPLPPGYERVKALVDTCFQDHKEQMREVQQVTVVRAANRPDHVRVRSTWQDPQFIACIEDAMHDAAPPMEQSDHARRKISLRFKYDPNVDEKR